MQEKLDFLINKFPALLRTIDADTKGQWGKMNVLQMIEHMTDSVREGNGKIKRTLMTAPEKIPAMMEFMMSEKEFKPNTKNALMGDEPAPVRNQNKEEAIRELESELNDFEKLFKQDPDAVVINPFFGNLHHDEWVQLLHKHARHHLKQFGGI
jgi:hypothetical protein